MKKKTLLFLLFLALASWVFFAFSKSAKAVPPQDATFTDNVAAGPVLTDTIAISAYTSGSNPTFKYAFSADAICNISDSYSNDFTSDEAFVISNESQNGNYICPRVTDDENGAFYGSASTNPLNIDITLIVFQNDVEEGPVQSDTIQITTGSLTNPTYKYAFSADAICNISDNYSNDFAPGQNFVIATENNNGNYVCPRVISDEGGTVYGDPSVFPLSIDTTPPTVTVTELTTTDTMPEISGTVNDDYATVIITLVSGETTYTYEEDCALGDFTWVFQIPDALADGTYNVIATAEDWPAGNTNTDSTTGELIIDTTPPGISISSPSASITRVGPVSYTITYSGASSVSLASNNVTLTATGTATGTVTASGSGSVTRTVTVSSISGDGTLKISLASGTAEDTLGHIALGAGPSTSFTVDNTSLSAPIADPAGGTYSSAQTVTLSFANDAAFTYYTLDGTDPDNTKTLYASTISIDGDNNQTKILKAISYDSAGNQSSVITENYIFSKSTADTNTTSTKKRYKYFKKMFHTSTHKSRYNRLINIKKKSRTKYLSLKNFYESCKLLSEHDLKNLLRKKALKSNYNLFRSYDGYGNYLKYKKLLGK